MSYLTRFASELYGGQNYTIGQNGSAITIFDANTNAVVDIGADIMDFTWRENYDKINPKTITGLPKPRSLPELVSGSFRLVRYTGSVEKLFSDARAAYYSTGVTRIFNIDQIVAPPGLPAVTNRIIGATFEFETAGTYARDAAIEISITFDAADWEQIS